MQGNVSSITAVEIFYRIRDRRVDGCIIGKNTGNAGDIKIIRIAVFFILRNAAGKVLVNASPGLPVVWLSRNSSLS